MAMGCYGTREVLILFCYEGMTRHPSADDENNDDFVAAIIDGIKRASVGVRESRKLAMIKGTRKS